MKERKAGYNIAEIAKERIRLAEKLQDEIEAENKKESQLNFDNENAYQMALIQALKFSPCREQAVATT